MNIKAGLFYLLIFLAVIFAFLGGQKLLQDQDIYENTTGRLMPNYIRQGGWDNPEIIKDTVAYLPITENNLINWDAAIYDCIRKHAYQPDQKCYDSFKVAFLPGFPLLWKFSGLGLRGISILNFGLYALSLILVLQIFAIPRPQSYWVFTLLLTFPNAIVFGLPYSEAMFAITGIAAAWAFIKGFKTWFFIFFALLMITRIASLFILLAIVLLAVLFLIQRKSKNILRNSSWLLLALLGLLVAYGIYFFMLWVAGRSPMDYFEATELGEAFLRWPVNFRDWSKEGFGMSSVAIFYILIPAFVISIRLLFLSKQRLFQLSRKGQVAMVSMFYLAGIFCFELLHSGGSLHSLHRIVFCSPAVIYLMAYLYKKMSAYYFSLYFALATIAVLVFWYFVPYTSGQVQSELLGMALIPLYILMYFAMAKSQRLFLKPAFLIIFLVGIWWATYLQNQLMSNAWIFT